MNTIEALRFAAEFLESKECHVYTHNGISWMALDRIGGAVKALKAEANKRESIVSGPQGEPSDAQVPLHVAIQAVDAALRSYDYQPSRQGAAEVAVAALRAAGEVGR